MLAIANLFLYLRVPIFKETFFNRYDKRNEI
jgi:hypothetical protein